MPAVVGHEAAALVVAHQHGAMVMATTQDVVGASAGLHQRAVVRRRVAVAAPHQAMAAVAVAQWRAVEVAGAVVRHHVAVAGVARRQGVAAPRGGCYGVDYYAAVVWDASECAMT